MHLFLRKRVFLNSATGRLGIIFQTPQNKYSKKACLGVNLGENCEKFSFRGCFSWRGKILIRVCFKNLWHACIQHLYSSAPLHDPRDADHPTPPNSKDFILSLSIRLGSVYKRVHCKRRHSKHACVI